MRRFLFLLLLCFPATLMAAPPQVAVSIKPVHSLVSNLMQGVVEPTLIVRTAGSPHGYNLRPSEARALQQADLVVWIGPDLESFMQKSISTFEPTSKVMTLLYDLPDLRRYPARRGGEWAGAEHDHDADRHSFDPHIWLSPANARKMALAITERLQTIDPPNGDRYQSNCHRLVKRLDSLDRQLSERLAPLRQKKFLVFHDAYQYFEKHFGLHPFGALAIDPNRRPGARRLVALKQVIRDQQIECIFAEPQFEPDLIAVLTENTTAKNGILDPLGADLQPGPDLYFRLLEQMAASYQACLATARKE